MPKRDDEMTDLEKIIELAVQGGQVTVHPYQRVSTSGKEYTVSPATRGAPGPKNGITNPGGALRSGLSTGRQANQANAAVASAMGSRNPVTVGSSSLGRTPLTPYTAAPKGSSSVSSSALQAGINAAKAGVAVESKAVAAQTAMQKAQLAAKTTAAVAAAKAAATQAASAKAALGTAAGKAATSSSSTKSATAAAAGKSATGTTKSSAAAGKSAASTTKTTSATTKAPATATKAPAKAPVAAKAKAAPKAKAPAKTPSSSKPSLSGLSGLGGLGGLGGGGGASRLNNSHRIIGARVGGRAVKALFGRNSSTSKAKESPGDKSAEEHRALRDAAALRREHSTGAHRTPTGFHALVGAKEAAEKLKSGTEKAVAEATKLSMSLEEIIDLQLSMKAKGYPVKVTGKLSNEFIILASAYLKASK